MKLHPIVDSTLGRLAQRFRRSWRPLASNDNRPRTGGWAETIWQD